MVASTLHAAVKAAKDGDSDVADGLKEFICLVAERCTDNRLARLREAARSAGFDLRVEDGGPRLLPLDEPHAPLSEAITALEGDFDRLGMSTASNHYRQAVESWWTGGTRSIKSV
ncbi:MAG: hypothetical protein ACRDT2_10670 [Natronosporangium sp.]